MAIIVIAAALLCVDFSTKVVASFKTIYTQPANLTDIV